MFPERNWENVTKIQRNPSKNMITGEVPQRVFSA
jgi:hypothetical protein